MKYSTKQKHIKIKFKACISTTYKTKIIVIEKLNKEINTTFIKIGYFS
jgi:hypothetical protein